MKKNLKYIKELEEAKNGSLLKKRMKHTILLLLKNLTQLIQYMIKIKDNEWLVDLLMRTGEVEKIYTMGKKKVLNFTGM